MYKGIVKKLLIDFISSKTYILMLLLLFCACFVFTSYNQVTNDYITNINYSIISHKNLYTFVVYPMIVIFTISLYNKISKNLSFLLRLNNKKDYYKIQLKSNILFSIIFFVMFLLTIIISININRNVSFSMVVDEYYNSLEILVLIVNLFKVYMSFIVLQLITIICMNLFKNKNISLLLIFIYIFYSHFSYKFEQFQIVKYIIPSVHIYSYTVYSSLIGSFLSSFVYYLFLIILLCFISRKIIIEKSVEREILL